MDLTFGVCWVLHFPGMYPHLSILLFVLSNVFKVVGYSFKSDAATELWHSKETNLLFNLTNKTMLTYYQK